MLAVDDTVALAIKLFPFLLEDLLADPRVLVERVILELPAAPLWAFNKICLIELIVVFLHRLQYNEMRTMTGLPLAIAGTSSFPAAGFNGSSFTLRPRIGLGGM
jgi:hypothetical protein